MEKKWRRKNDEYDATGDGDYEYEDEEEYYMLKANIKELQKEIKKMGKQEYLKQRKANRKGASTAFNESYKELKNIFSQMKKFGDTEKNPSFGSRVKKKLRERPNKIGFEIDASTKSINLSELMYGPVVPVPQKGIKVKAWSSPIDLINFKGYKFSAPVLL